MPSDEPQETAGGVRSRSGIGPPMESHTIRSVDELRALAHPLRQRILAGFAGDPVTTKRLAERLGEKAGRLYHHVDALEAAGLVRLVETRPKRGTVEKLYQAVARSFEVGAEAITSPEGAPRLGELQGRIVASLTQTLRAARSARLRELEERPDGVAGMHVHTRVRATADDLRRLAGFVQAWIESVARDRQGDAPSGGTAAPAFLLDVTAVALPRPGPLSERPPGGTLE